THWSVGWVGSAVTAIHRSLRGLLPRMRDAASKSVRFSRAAQQKRPAHVRFGSGATDALKAARPSMSASPRKRPLWHEHSIRRFVPGPDIYLVIIYPRCRRESVRPWGGSK